MSGATRTKRAMLRDAPFVALLAVLTVQALRRHVGDRYLVPSGSMEPVLHGHPVQGDQVLVDKTANAAARRRGDIVVVAHPEQAGQQLVKRIAACGDVLGEAWIDIRQGDVWLGDDPQRLQREQKDPLAARARRVRWAVAEPGTHDDHLELAAAGPGGRTPPLASTADEARSLLRARAGRRLRALPAGCIGAARPVDATFLDVTGARSPLGADVNVNDAGIELVVDALAGELLATIDCRAGVLTFHWQPTSGRVVLWRDGVDVDSAVVPVGTGAGRVEFGLLDDRVFFHVDGAPAPFVVGLAAAWTAPPPGSPPSPPRSVVHVGCVGKGAGLQWRRLTVFRDVHAWREPIVGPPGQPGSWPRNVPPGHWFLLGDSSFDSRDSRQFGAVSSATFLGVPWAVLGPWPRARWVTP